MAVVRKLIDRDFELRKFRRLCEGLVEHFDKVAIYVQPHEKWIPVKKAIVEKWSRIEIRPGHVNVHSNSIRVLVLRQGRDLVDSVQATFAIDGDEDFIAWLCLKYL